MYTSKRNLIARPLGKKYPFPKKMDLDKDQYHFLKKKNIANTNEEYSRLIRSELFKNKPDFWEGNIYEIGTIKEILDRQNW